MNDVERERLAALRSYEVLDTPPEAAFDRITLLAADLFSTPMAAVTLLDAERQWLKSRVGIEAEETPRKVAFCDHAIRGDDVMVVPDATLDPRFADNPLVLDGPRIRFYAGAPLKLNSGLKLGALCVIDTKPRAGLSDEETRRLTTLAQVVVDELELRLAGRHLIEAKAQAEAAMQAKADFLATMTHELRSPLTSIIGFSGLLTASGGLEGKDRHFAERIQAASNGLLALVNDVLDLGKLEAGAVQVIEQPVTVRGFLQDLVSLFRVQADAKGLNLTLQVADKVPVEILTDVAWLRQILTNLLSNAVKFTEVGEVTLAAEVEGGEALFEVRDTGPGIPADRLDHVFERYAQADAEVARRHGGTGLGLTIARKLANTLGGDLRVRSQVGEGSTFCVRLPLHTA
jgi:two-component system, sensor histidine kinase